MMVQGARLIRCLWAGGAAACNPSTVRSR
ncbi:hypothetical protein A2U01_0059158, partial [Trifolium medium]|nr:hypothetical protein [Trifolium medium]